MPSKQNTIAFDKVEQEALAKIFKDIVYIERELESNKIELALKADFNLKDAFRLFDLKGIGSFTAQDLVQALDKQF